MAEHLRVAWIDSRRLIRECMMSAFVAGHPSLTLIPYTNVETCLETVAAEGVDIVVYHSYQLGAELSLEVAALRKAVDLRPIVLFADAGDRAKLRWICDALRSGANGYICTRTRSLSMAIASLLFVRAGGTFVPLELLPTERERAVEARERTATDWLTDRQLTVLAQLKQGKSNKVIARELGMSESTVKVHIRTIMRKTGAVNRTQAAFLAMGAAVSVGEPNGAILGESGDIMEEDINDGGG